MVQTIYDLDTLGEELSQLPPFHRIAFGASICERLLPNYSPFAKEEGLDGSVLRTALDQVWQILQGKPVGELEIRELISRCKKTIVHLDEVESSYEYASDAQEAAIAICNILHACLEPSARFVVGVAVHVTYTIDGFLIQQKESSDPSWENKPYEDKVHYVLAHPFAVREIAKQQEDLQKLKDAETLEAELLEWLRTTSHNNGKSLIDLS